jgi:hypothetical protein
MRGFVWFVFWWVDSLGASPWGASYFDSRRRLVDLPLILAISFPHHSHLAIQTKNLWLYFFNNAYFIFLEFGLLTFTRFFFLLIFRYYFDQRNRINLFIFYWPSIDFLFILSFPFRNHILLNMIHLTFLWTNRLDGIIGIPLTIHILFLNTRVGWFSVGNLNLLF